MASCPIHLVFQFILPHPLRIRSAPVQRASTGSTPRRVLPGCISQRVAEQDTNTNLTWCRPQRRCELRERNTLLSADGGGAWMQAMHAYTHHRRAPVRGTACAPRRLRSSSSPPATVPSCAPVGSAARRHGHGRGLHATGPQCTVYGWTVCMRGGGSLGTHSAQQPWDMPRARDIQVRRGCGQRGRCGVSVLYTTPLE